MFHSQTSRPGFFRQNSGRSFKLLELRRGNQQTHGASRAGVSSPPRLSPPSTPTSPENTLWPPGDPYSRTCRRIPTVCMCSSVRPARLHHKHGEITCFCSNWPFFTVTQIEHRSFFYFTGARAAKSFHWVWLIFSQQLVLRINSIFEARIGKKHLRRIYHYAEATSGRGDVVKCFLTWDCNVLMWIFALK